MTATRRLAACMILSIPFWGTPLAAQNSETQKSPAVAPKPTGGKGAGTEASGTTGPEITKPGITKPGATASTFISPPSALPDPDPELSASCQAMLNTIRELDKKIPKSFQGLRRSVEEIAADMDKCAQLCRQFLDECPGRVAEQYTQRLLGRMLLGTSSHIRKKLFDDLRVQGLEGDALRSAGAAKMDAYFAEVRNFATAAYQACEEKTLEHFLALLLLIDLNTQSGTGLEMQSHVENMAKNYPDYPLLGEQMFKVGKAFVTGRKYTENVAYMDRVIQRRKDDPWYVIFNISLFDGLQGTASFDRMLGLMGTIQSDYPKLLPSLRGIPRTQAQQWFDVSGFWQGFTKYALGDTAGAVEAFAQNERYLSEKVGRLEAEKKYVDPVVKVYLDYRTRDYLTFINDFHGRPPAVDFDLGPLWATDEKVTLAKSLGKVVVVLFREPGTYRSRDFYQYVDRYVAEHESEGIVGVTVGYLLGAKTPGRDEEAVFKMQLEMSELGISMAGGFDPDRKHHSIFQGMHGTVGPSTTFVVLNRKGEFAWYLFDPRSMDGAIASKVLDRLLKESP